MPVPAILFSEMTPPAGEEAAFDRWYDEEHIPIRMAAPLFTGARRYRDGATRNYLAVYELKDASALATPEYQRIKGEPSAETRRMLGAVSGFTRYVGRRLTARWRAGVEQLGSSVLYAVFFQVPEDRLAEFDAWNEDDHLPTLLEDERWLGVRRFDVVDGTLPFNRLALHHLADRAALDGAARQRARASRWRERLATEAWFKGRYLVFDRLEKQFEPTPCPTQSQTTSSASSAPLSSSASSPPTP